MKKFFVALLLIYFYPASFCLAGQNAQQTIKPPDTNEQQSLAPLRQETGVRPEYVAEQKVKMLPSRHGKTIDSYLTNMAKIPVAEDLGWEVTEAEDGFEVVRSILIKNKTTYFYRWKVFHSGEVIPVNDRAKKLMDNP